MQPHISTPEAWIDKISLAYNNFKDTKPFKIHGPASPTCRPMTSHHWNQVTKENGKIENVIFWVYHPDMSPTLDNLQPAVIIYDMKKPIYLIEESDWPRFFGLSSLPERNVTRCGNKVVPIIPNKLFQSLQKTQPIASSPQKVEKPATPPPALEPAVVATPVNIPNMQSNIPPYMVPCQPAYSYEQVQSLQQHNQYLKQKINSCIKKYTEICRLYQEKELECRTKTDSLSKLQIQKQQLEAQNKTLEDKANHYKELYESAMKFRQETKSEVQTKQISTQTETSSPPQTPKRPREDTEDDMPQNKKLFIDLNDPDALE